MPLTAPVIQYRKELVKKFEVTQSLLRMQTTTEAVINGASAVFDVGGSFGEAVTRGVNGEIPYTGTSQAQITCALSEQHGTARQDGFDIFASQGGDAVQRALLQSSTISKINRKIDNQIITSLNTTSVFANASADVFTKSLVNSAIAKLGYGKVPFNGEITLVVSPGAYVRMTDWPEFTNSMLVDRKPLASGQPAWADQPIVFNWLGTMVIVHPNLPGAGTNDERLFMFHKRAIGHAMNVGGMKVDAEYRSEQDYSWSRASGYMGAEVLQGTGIIAIRHDASAFA
jgi:hypothetical protein